MGIFEYEAFNQAGKKTKGLLDAGTIQEAREKLRALNLFPIEVLPGSEIVKRRKRWGKIKKEEIALLTRQLSSLLRSGLPLVEAIESLAQQYEDKNLQRILLDIGASIREGKTFYNALLQYPYVFPPLYVNMIKAAEESGDLDKVLSHLSYLLFREITFKNKVKNAFTYPLFVLAVGTGVLIFLLIRVIPSLSKLFAQFNYPLPLLTNLLIGFSQYLIKNGKWIGGGIVTLGIILCFIYRKFREKIDEWRVKIPFLGKIFLRIMLTNFSFTLASLIKGGVPILEALTLSRPILNNRRMERAVQEAEERIKRGESFSRTLKEHSLFPPLFIQMVELGEKGGNLEEMLDESSRVYEEETEILLSRFSILLEPIVIVGVGVVVGVIVIAVLLPIFEMNEILMGK